MKGRAAVFASIHAAGVNALLVAATCLFSVSNSAVAAPRDPVQANALLDVSGSGTKSTQTFTTFGDEWSVTYIYDCANFGMKGNFQVYIKNGAGALTSVGVNVLGNSGDDTEYYHVSGTFFLEVNSECNWHIVVHGTAKSLPSAVPALPQIGSPSSGAGSVPMVTSLGEASTADSRGDYATELRILRPLAEAGDRAAEYALGAMYMQGHGVLESYVTGVEWFHKAANHGLAEAQVEYGLA